MSADVVALINTGLKLAVELISVASELQQKGIEVPALADVKARLKALQDSPPLPTKPAE